MSGLKWLPWAVLYTLTMLANPLGFLPGPAAAAVIINEILADPARDWDGDGVLDSRDDEWVEVLNTGPDAVDLVGYWLRDDAASGPRLNLFGVLAVGETAVFYGSQAVAWQQEQGQTVAGLSLNNGGDRVILLRTVAGSDPLAYEDVDFVDYTSHQVVDDRSCGWSVQRDQWLLFDALNPYAGSLEPGGSGCAPTPGAPNLCDSSVDARDSSFGELKASYR
ncbi:MAG: lamin tail domain-containing protein [Krumholzibacteria bacterium]|nr:lamin tail domain-containing protein [Candidatus Krumholzibacteria bacterium]